MYSVINTATINGIDSTLCLVEVDISEGLPMFEMVGFLSAEVKEAKERVRAALRHEGVSLPVKRITVNLSPANIRKSGSGFDLPIAMAILSAIGIVECDKLDEIVMMGEISLDGRILPLAGVLPMVLEARNCGKKICVVPKENAKEAMMVPDMEIVAVKSLTEIISYLNTGEYQRVEDEINLKTVEEYEYDFSMINGQPMMRRACEVAISGMHNLLMVGAPGAGKSMIAKCIPSILPDMSLDEQMELSKIYSVCGQFNERAGLMSKRPFRSPHHTISEPGLIGGGSVSNPHPGEISLAHKGCLFLDELTEFRKSTLEVLRQPLEDKKVAISRAYGSFTYPADTVLIAAMNPCKCGYYPDHNKCNCTPAQVQSYIGKISQPLLDRIDICVQAPTLSFDEITHKEKNEASAEIRKRVVACQEIQKDRYEKYGFSYNSQIPSNLIEEFCRLSSLEVDFMKERYESLGLTARTYHKVLKVARTIADMEQVKDLEIRHLEEAFLYRSLDKSYWEGRI